jgi:hypothetical protein
MADLKAAIFTDPRMQSVYYGEGADIQLSSTYTVWNWVQLYAAVDYLRRRGLFLEAEEKTFITEIPVSFGIKPFVELSSKSQYFLALGPQYIYVHQHTRSATGDRNTSDHGFGGFLKTGFTFFPISHLVIDAFLEYTFGWADLNFSEEDVSFRTVQIGTIAFGAGLGWTF